MRIYSTLVSIKVGGKKQAVLQTLEVKTLNKICICTTIVVQKSMSKSSIVQARMEPELKASAESIFRELGLNSSQAISIFYKQVELSGGLPFKVVVPNEQTRKTFQQTDDGQDLTVCEDAQDMFKKLGL